MEEKFGLNEINNLNPVVNPTGPGLAGDKPKDIKVKKDGDGNGMKFFKLIAFLGVVALLIIAGICGYIFYRDGTLFPKAVCAPVIPQCPELPNITIPPCPVCPSAPDCNCGNPNITVIPNITLNPTINVPVQVVNGS